MIRRLLSRPVAWIVLVVVLAGAGFGLYWFTPWKLFTNDVAHDQLSTVAPSAGAGAGTSTCPCLLAQATFISHEHTTTGTARIVKLADGSRRLELVGLDTSNGPDLHVWLTDQKVVPGAAGWKVFDDGRYLDLGPLKGNRGDQAYEIPADLELSQYHSVTVWCQRFSVSFGAADLDPITGA